MIIQILGFEVWLWLPGLWEGSGWRAWCTLDWDGWKDAAAASKTISGKVRLTVDRSWRWLQNRQKLKLSQSTDWRSSTRFCPARAWQTGSWRWLVGEVWAPKTTSYAPSSLNMRETWRWVLFSHSRFFCSCYTNCFGTLWAQMRLKLQPFLLAWQKWRNQDFFTWMSESVSKAKENTDDPHAGWSNETRPSQDLLHCPRLFWGMNPNVSPLQGIRS